MAPFHTVDSFGTWDNSAKSGFNFINEEGYCYLTIALNEENGNLRTIEQDWHIEPINQKWKNHNDMHIVYLDDKAGFEEDVDYIKKKVACNKFLGKICAKQDEDVFISMKFAKFLYSFFTEYFNVDDYINNDIYSFQEEFSRIFWSLEMLVGAHADERKAQDFYLEFLKFDVVTDDLVKPWIEKVTKEIPISLCGFEYEVNYRQRLIFEHGIRYNFDEFVWTHALSKVCHKYRNLTSRFLSTEEFEKHFEMNENKSDFLSD